jgi:hypothetical protein
MTLTPDGLLDGEIAWHIDGEDPFDDCRIRIHHDEVMFTYEHYGEEIRFEGKAHQPGYYRLNGSYPNSWATLRRISETEFSGTFRDDTSQGTFELSVYPEPFRGPA